MTLLDDPVAELDGPGRLDAAERAELECYRAAFRELAAVTERAAGGDLEARVGRLGDEAVMEQTRWSVNRLLDLADAFVREAGATLQAASEGRYHRELLSAGFRGAFADGARLVDSARMEIASANRRAAAADRVRRELADQFESAVLSASEHVAAASTELGATAAYLTEAADSAVREAGDAAGAIAALDTSSATISDVVTLIRAVAMRTRMLSFNAAVEAAAAGEAGRGFAVVASEVKQLANEVRDAVDRIEREVGEVRDAAASSSTVLDGIADQVREIHGQSTGILAAVDGGPAEGAIGLAQLAEVLSAEATAFLGHLRA